MGKFMKKAILCVFAAAAGALALKVVAQVTCTLTTSSFTENFTATTYKDAANTAVYGWTPDKGITAPIELPRLGANFAVTKPGGLGAHIYCTASGDFDGDGYPDLVGLELTGPSSNYQNTSRIVYLKNNYPTAGVAQWIEDLTVVNDPYTTYVGPNSICVGDFNGDGLLDFFYMRNGADQFGYTNFAAVMYINVGTKTKPMFNVRANSSNLDFTSAFQTAKIYANWTANHLCAVDIDKDGDVDILVASESKIFLIRNPGSKNFKLSNFTIGEISYNQNTGFAATGTVKGTDNNNYDARGTSCIAAADFDRDGNIDIVCGSVNNYGYLVYYKNDGTGHFTRSTITIPTASCTGPCGVAAIDFTGDGLPDIFGAGDAWCAGNQSHMWILRNAGVKAGVVQWTFQCLNNCNPIIPPSYDDDIVEPLDYDHDGDIDIILCDANHSGDYYLVVNMLADVFALNGTAQSTNVTPTLDASENALTSVRVSSLSQSWRGQSNAGLTVTVYFSANGGTDWELYATYQGNAITNVTNSAADAGWYDFKNFGTDLRWKIVLQATEDTMADYTAASFSTPRIFSLALQYKYVNRQEYSRSSASATVVTSSGQTKKLIIASSFIYPGWEGELRAYDVSTVSVGTGGYSTLTTLTTSDLGSPSGRTVSAGTAIFWDAGELLNGRSPDSRVVYTAIRPGKDLAQPLQRTDFTVANATLLAPFLQDVQNDNAGLINFVRGTGRDWKLGDLNHSTPAVVGPPVGTASLMGAGYSDFVTAQQNRTKVLYIGANDGMLHCFDVLTGTELWAFIPYNLLPKLRNQWAVDQINHDRYYAHDIFVDGSPSVSDVYMNGQWRTVLVCGQGPGKGSTMAGGYNYYWALDVTDPANPLPLWEITHLDASGQYTMGETWSIPAIGRINDAGTDRWVAFMGSGYDNIGQKVAGRTFYVVRIDTGAVLWTTTVGDVDTSLFTAPRSAYTDIQPAFVASPTTVDTNSDGYVNYVYAADLDGRLYRLDVGNSSLGSWTFSTIYTDYSNYPIITKPAVWINPYSDTRIPQVYFGTGGDDAAPANRDYSFIALSDLGASGVTIDWYMGNPTALNLSSDKKEGELGAGYKVWADPVVADFTVYFTTLPGSIENVNPCLNLDAAGRLYSRQLRVASGIPIGGSALRSSSTVPPEYMQMVSKARRAVTLGEIQRTPAPESISKREVFMQEYNSTIEMLANPVGALLQIKSWREVYQVIR
ncbi:MAG TPA: PilC/PilY family type IV pilus protein [Terriglobales bacterium]|nr:PilC/PilY family type IV pilus protein [Terriglobales bacterium]